jgi:AraC-like DNA-binding protein
MAETLFCLDTKNYRDGQALFRGERNQEYYCGDFWVEDGSAIDVRAEHRAVGPCSIILLKSSARQFFRRTRRHIRDDATDLSVLWFVKRGRLVFSDQAGSRTAAPGDFIVTRSMSPFLIECQPDAEAMHEVLHVTVPTHILRGFLATDIASALFLPGDRREVAIAQKILTSVFRDEDLLSDASARTLVDAALTIVGHAIRAEEAGAPARQTVADRRLVDVLRFIEVHLSDPNLSTSMVAKGCGISPRYLSFLLRLKGTSFSELVWEQRLEKARLWLSSSQPRDISISEIAYGVGFKSPAHFSRMFKRVFAMNPREFRTCAPEDAVQQDYARYTSEGQLLQ